MSRAEEIRATIRPLIEELNEIERRTKKDAMSGLVGRCFKTRNCYSCPESDSDYWWLYRRVTGINDGGALQTETFQKDKYGKIEIETKANFGSVSGMEEISISEYVNAWADLVHEVNSIDPKA